ncbi:MAG: hypothetical protein AAGD22_07650 [Verrucomicrobiota bacterium]
MYQDYVTRYKEGIAPSAHELWDAHEVVQRYLKSRLQGEGRRSRKGAFVDEALGSLELVLFQIETCLPGIEHEQGALSFEDSSPHEAVEALSWCEIALERLSDEAARQDSASPLATWLQELASMHAALAAEVIAAWIISGGSMEESTASTGSVVRTSVRVDEFELPRRSEAVLVT